MARKKKNASVSTEVSPAVNSESVDLANKLASAGIPVPENASEEDIQGIFVEDLVNKTVNSECYGKFHDPGDPTCISCLVSEACLVEVTAKEVAAEAEIAEETAEAEAQAEALADESTPVLTQPVDPPAPKQKAPRAPRSGKSSVDVASFALADKGKLAYVTDDFTKIEVTFTKGDRVKVINSKSVHKDKEGTVKNYSPKYNDLWVSIDGWSQPVTAFKPHHVVHVV